MTPQPTTARTSNDWRTSAHYDPARHHTGDTCTVRPGSLRAFALPSRVGPRLYWPDGRTTHLDGTPLATPHNTHPHTTQETT
jgi:hypothetical protein